MEPKISHRCKSCGASFRDGQEVCHQCGEPFVGSSMPESAAIDPAQGSPIKRTERSLPSVPPGDGATMRELPFAKVKPVVNTTSIEADAATGIEPDKAGEASDAGNTKRHGVRHAARGMVTENVMPRVEKLRNASSAVLEEAAAIDPSLRFVLIAILLFIVFVVLLVFSFIK